jgi:hypothetical protein
MPSPTTSKGHMKCPQKGMQSTTVWPKLTAYLSTPPSASLPIGHLLMPGLIFDKDNDSFTSSNGPTLITDMDNDSIANIFCFGAITDTNKGNIYNDCMGEFPFMSLDSMFL